MAKVQFYTFTRASKILDLSSNYIAKLVEKGLLTEETEKVQGTRERFVTAASVEKLKAQREQEGQ